MRYLLTLGACLAVSGTLAVGYLAFPRTERVAVGLPAQTSPAILKAALGNVETVDTPVTMVGGQRFRCLQASGTRWCRRTTSAHARDAERISQG